MDLTSPVTLGDLQLPNRLVMAPLTRTRAGAAGVPGPMLAQHYAQRASTGLIVAEGTYPSHESRSYAGQPGLVTDEQQAGWQTVADAVHARGGRIVVQLMNGGRVSHTDITGTERIVGPSAVAIAGEVHTGAGKKAFPVPHALTTEEIADVVAEFVAAARRAVDAGLDGVEVHGANGYLLHQFLAPGANQREDEYGGSPANRARLAIEVTRAVAAEVGASRVGLRISPAHNIQDAFETDPADVEATYQHLAEQLQPLGLAYLSVLHADPSGELVQGLRKRFGGPLMVNTGFSSQTTRDEAQGYLADGVADVVAVGRSVMANPDLLERWTGGHPENELDPTTSYGNGPEGYVDYPFLDGSLTGPR